MQILSHPLPVSSSPREQKLPTCNVTHLLCKLAVKALAPAVRDKSAIDNFIVLTVIINSNSGAARPRSDATIAREHEASANNSEEVLMVWCCDVSYVERWKGESIVT